MTVLLTGASGTIGTGLLPNRFMQNDAMFKDALLGHRIYPLPIGEAGVYMVDVRDIAEIAASAILGREMASDPPPLDVVNLVGPQGLTGSGIAALWSRLLCCNGFSGTACGPAPMTLRK